MKNIMFKILLICALFLLNGCQKDENEPATLDGLWYVRSEIMHTTSNGNTMLAMYKLYKRTDVANKRYVTFNFKKNKLVVETYGRDKNMNTNMVLLDEYEMQVAGDQIHLISKDGDSKIYNYSFVGLSSKSLKLEFIDELLNEVNIKVVRDSKTLLIREFPKDDSEEKEVFPPSSGGGTPTDGQAN